MMNPEFMREAIRLSIENINHGGGPFAAVVVKDGKIVAATGNSVTADNDPTAHAEVNAIRQACKKLNTFDLSGCDIYASCEPCPMCLSAIYWAHIDHIYYAAPRKDAASIGFDDNMIYEQIPMNPAERSIPGEQILRDEAMEAFKIWNDSSDTVTHY